MAVSTMGFPSTSGPIFHANPMMWDAVSLNSTFGSYVLENDGLAPATGLTKNPVGSGLAPPRLITHDGRVLYRAVWSPVARYCLANKQT
jgi:hypothetical protein